MTSRPAPGTRLVFRWRKWDGSPHWEQDCVYLGSDDWGDWFGQQIGWRSVRPGREFVCREPNVTLVPASGDWAFTHNAAPHPVAVYIDLAWDAGWDDDGAPVGIDMDLDVVRRTDGRGTWIDDPPFSSSVANWSGVSFAPDATRWTVRSMSAFLTSIFSVFAA